MKRERELVIGKIMTPNGPKSTSITINKGIDRLEELNRSYVVASNSPAIIKGGIYQHYKGTFVEVLGIGKNTETNEEVVVYRHVGFEPPNKVTHVPFLEPLWIRPIEIWNEIIESRDVTENGTFINQVPRFKLVWIPDSNNKENSESKTKLGFRCDKCRKPSHAGTWGCNYPKPCFWCKGEYVYPGHPVAEECTDYEPMDPNNQFDTRPVLC